MAFNLISKSGSPVLTSQTLDAARDYDFSDNNRETMTMSGFSNKLIMLVAITAIIAMALVNVLDVGSSVMLSSVSAIVGFILVLVMSIKPNTAPYIAVPYAVAEGCFLSGVVLYHRIVADKPLGGQKMINFPDLFSCGKLRDRPG